MKVSDKTIVAVVGLGYVGLPLAAELGVKYETIGYDLSSEKINRLNNFDDPTGSVSPEGLRAARKLTVSDDPGGLARADMIIIAVPTPVNEARVPDFDPLISASKLVGRYMKRGSIVVYESTVYPRVAEMLGQSQVTGESDAQQN